MVGQVWEFGGRGVIQGVPPCFSILTSNTKVHVAAFQQVNFNDQFGGGNELTDNLIFNSCRESSDHGTVTLDGGGWWGILPQNCSLDFLTFAGAFNSWGRQVRLVLHPC